MLNRNLDQKAKQSLGGGLFTPEPYPFVCTLTVTAKTRALSVYFTRALSVYMCTDCYWWWPFHQCPLYQSSQDTFSTFVPHGIWSWATGLWNNCPQPMSTLSTDPARKSCLPSWIPPLGITWFGNPVWRRENNTLPEEIILTMTTLCLVLNWWYLPSVHLSSTDGFDRHHNVDRRGFGGFKSHTQTRVCVCVCEVMSKRIHSVLKKGKLFQKMILLNRNDFWKVLGHENRESDTFYTDSDFDFDNGSGARVAGTSSRSSDCRETTTGVSWFYCEKLLLLCVFKGLGGTLIWGTSIITIDVSTVGIREDDGITSATADVHWRIRTAVDRWDWRRCRDWQAQMHRSRCRRCAAAQQ